MKSARFLIASLAAAGAIIGVVVGVPSGEAGLGSASGRSACTPVWRNVPNPRIKEGTLASVAAVSATDAWAVGGVVRRDKYGDEVVSASPLIEHWDGKSWSVVASPKFEGALSDVAVASRRDAWAVGWEDLARWGNADRVLLHWDGTRWSRMSLPESVRDMNAIAALSARDVWVVGDPSDRLAEIYHWDGTRWTVVASHQGSLATLEDVAAISARDVWAVGSVGWEPYSALAMHWDGARWRTFVRRGDAWLSVVAGLSGSDVWAGGAKQQEGMSPGAIDPLLLHWDGRTWKTWKQPRAESGFSGIAPLSSREIWAVGENPIDYKTNSGVGSSVWHWAAGKWQSTALANGRTFSDIAAVRAHGAASTVLWAVGQIGTAPNDHEGYFPAHTVPFIGRFGC